MESRTASCRPKKTPERTPWPVDRWSSLKVQRKRGQPELIQLLCPNHFAVKRPGYQGVALHVPRLGVGNRNVGYVQRAAQGALVVNFCFYQVDLRAQFHVP